MSNNILSESIVKRIRENAEAEYQVSSYQKPLGQTMWHLAAMKAGEAEALRSMGLVESLEKIKKLMEPLKNNSLRISLLYAEAEQALKEYAGETVTT